MILLEEQRKNERHGQGVGKQNIILPTTEGRAHRVVLKRPFRTMVGRSGGGGGGGATVVDETCQTKKVPRN